MCRVHLIAQILEFSPVHQVKRFPNCRFLPEYEIELWGFGKPGELDAVSERPLNPARSARAARRYSLVHARQLLHRLVRGKLLEPKGGGG